MLHTHIKKGHLWTLWLIICKCLFQVLVHAKVIGGISLPYNLILFLFTMKLWVLSSILGCYIYIIYCIINCSTNRMGPPHGHGRWTDLILDLKDREFPTSPMEIKGSAQQPPDEEISIFSRLTFVRFNFFRWVRNLKGCSISYLLKNW